MQRRRKTPIPVAERAWRSPDHPGLTRTRLTSVHIRGSTIEGVEPGTRMRRLLLARARLLGWQGDGGSREGFSRGNYGDLLTLLELLFFLIDARTVHTGRQTLSIYLMSMLRHSDKPSVVVSTSSLRCRSLPRSARILRRMWHPAGICVLSIVHCHSSDAPLTYTLPDLAQSCGMRQ